MTDPSQSSSTAPDPGRSGQSEPEPATSAPGAAVAATDQPVTPTPDAVWAGQPPIGPDGRQVPVAVLPGAPAVQPAPGSEQAWNGVPAAAPAPPRPRGRVGLVAVAVVVFVAAATFGTLWFVERGNHADTAKQAEVVRQDRDRLQKDADKAEVELRQTKERLTEAASERRKYEQQAFDNSTCSEAGRKVAKVVDEKGSDEAFHDALDSLLYNCF